jgi:hypothetical protein
MQQNEAQVSANATEKQGDLHTLYQDLCKSRQLTPIEFKIKIHTNADDSAIFWVGLFRRHSRRTEKDEGEESKEEERERGQECPGGRARRATHRSRGTRDLKIFARHQSYLFGSIP